MTDVTPPTPPEAPPPQAASPQAGPPQTVPTVAAPVRAANPLAGFGAVYLWGLRLLLKPKRLIILGGLTFAVAALLGWVVTKSDGDPVSELWSMFDFLVLKQVLPIFALVLVSQSYSRELRDGTMVYHLVRPVARHTVFLARYASAITPALLLVVVFVFVLTGASKVEMPTDMKLRLSAVAGLSVITLGALYYTLAAVFRHGVIAGLAYTFVVEIMLGFLPGTTQKLAINFHARSLYHGLADGWFAANSAEVASILERKGSGQGAFAEMMAALFKQVSYDPPGAAAMTLVVVAAILLAVGCWHARRRDFALKD